MYSSTPPSPARFGACGATSPRRGEDQEGDPRVGAPHVLVDQRPPPASSLSCAARNAPRRGEQGQHHRPLQGGREFLVLSPSGRGAERSEAERAGGDIFSRTRAFFNIASAQSS